MSAKKVRENELKESLGAGAEIIPQVRGTLSP
jgi:hypothetical protein